MSDKLDTIQSVDMEFTVNENVIGDVPPLHAGEIYRAYDKKRAEFVDAATYAHEVELHQAAMKRITELERALDAANQRAAQFEADARRFIQFIDHDVDCARNLRGESCDCGLSEMRAKYLDGAK